MNWDFSILSPLVFCLDTWFSMTEPNMAGAPRMG